MVEAGKFYKKVVGSVVDYCRVLEIINDHEFVTVGFSFSTKINNFLIVSSEPITNFFDEDDYEEISRKEFDTKLMDLVNRIKFNLLEGLSSEDYC